MAPGPRKLWKFSLRIIWAHTVSPCWWSLLMLMLCSVRKGVQFWIYCKTHCNSTSAAKVFLASTVWAPPNTALMVCIAKKVNIKLFSDSLCEFEAYHSQSTYRSSAIVQLIVRITASNSLSGPAWRSLDSQQFLTCKIIHLIFLAHSLACQQEPLKYKTQLANKYFELKNLWGADGAPQTRTTC